MSHPPLSKHGLRAAQQAALVEAARKKAQREAAVKAVRIQADKKRDEEEAAQKKANQAQSSERVVTPEEWRLTIVQVLADGLIARGNKTSELRDTGGYTEVVGNGAYGPMVYRVPRQTRPPDPVEIFVVGHPDKNKLAIGSQITILANPDGTANIMNRALEKWVYEERSPTSAR